MILTGCLSVTSGVVVAYLHNQHNTKIQQLKTDQRCDDNEEYYENDVKRVFIPTTKDIPNDITVENTNKCESCKKNIVSRNTDKQNDVIGLDVYKNGRNSNTELATLVNRILFGVCILITVSSMGITSIKMITHVNEA